MQLGTMTGWCCGTLWIDGCIQVVQHPKLHLLEVMENAFSFVIKAG